MLKYGKGVHAMSVVNESNYHNGNYWLSGYNYVDEVKKACTLMDYITVHDVTLRDGEQTPGVVFRKE